MKVSRVREAFGNWHVESPSIEELKNAQVIVTQSAEMLRDGTAGPGNILLAEHADRLHKRFNLPIIAQRELLVAKPDLPVLATVGATPDGGVPYRPADTLAVCKAQKKICDEHGWKNVLVVAFPDHMWRACQVYKKLGLHPIPAIMLGNPNMYYHKNARRWQLRSRAKFKYFWEIPARLLFLHRDWM